jgi:hypothetical protein
MVSSSSSNHADFLALTLCIAFFTAFAATTFAFATTNDTAATTVTAANTAISAFVVVFTAVVVFPGAVSFDSSSTVVVDVGVKIDGEPLTYKRLGGHRQA